MNFIKKKITFGLKLSFISLSDTDTGIDFMILILSDTFDIKWYTALLTNGGGVISFKSGQRGI